MTQKVVFYDLDSTVCDTSGRHHLINREDYNATDWEVYAMACDTDLPVDGVIALLRQLKLSGYLMVAVSGRNASARAKTVAWLDRYFVPHDYLILRELSYEGIPNEDLKLMQVTDWCLAHRECDPVLLIDDWPPVKEKMATLSIPTLLVRVPYELASTPDDPGLALRPSDRR